MRGSVCALALFLSAVASGTETAHPPVEDVGTVMAAFGAHLDEHPAAGAEDLYKFLHQAVYGPGHAIADREAARRWLAREISSLGPPFEDEPRCEVLGGEPPLVRVNLRPFVESGADAGQLLEAFVASASKGRGDSRRMKVVLSLAASYVRCAGRGELAPELEALSVDLAGRGYPAIHHSEEYAEAYHPAYRVVEQRLAAEHGWCEESPTR